MSERKEFVCINKDCDFCISEGTISWKYKNGKAPNCVECDAPLQENVPASTSGEAISVMLNEAKMCWKSVNRERTTLKIPIFSILEKGLLCLLQQLIILN